MTIQDALEKLKIFTCNVPADGLETVRANWTDAEPLLLEEMDWRIQNPLEEDRSALFLYALHLCAEMKCETAFDRYVQLLRMPATLLDWFLGDILTESMAEMLTRTCAGRIDELKVLIEDERVYDFARGAALDALQNLMLDGVFPRDELAAYVSQLLTHKLEREPSSIWDSAASLAESLGMREALPAIEAAYSTGLCNPGMQSLESVRSGLETQSVDEALACARKERRGFSSAEHEMRFFVAQWSNDGVIPERDPSELLKEPAAARRKCRELRKNEPGRNDPCPCGSGRKYKKCCIETGIVMSDDEPKIHVPPSNRADEWMAAGYHYLEQAAYGYALECWRYCWQAVLRMFPESLTDPCNPECDQFFNACGFFSNWLEDYQMLLKEHSEMSIEALRDGLKLCHEAPERFSAMDDLMRNHLEELYAMLLVRTGRASDGVAILENMILRHPDSAQGYVLLSELVSWDAQWSNLRPDWQRAEQLLRQARMSAKDCEDWDVEVRLDDLRRKLKGKNEPGE